MSGLEQGCLMMTSMPMAQAAFGHIRSAGETVGGRCELKTCQVLSDELRALVPNIIDLQQQRLDRVIVLQDLEQLRDPFQADAILAKVHSQTPAHYEAWKYCHSTSRVQA